MLLQQYHDKFQALVQVIDEVKINIADQGLIKTVTIENGQAANAATNADKRTTRECALAICFLRGTNHKHKTYLTHLHNSHLDGKNYYPKMVAKAYSILHRCEEDPSPAPAGGEGVAFTLTSKEVAEQE